VRDTIPPHGAPLSRALPQARLYADGAGERLVAAQYADNRPAATRRFNAPLHHTAWQDVFRAGVDILICCALSIPKRA